MVFRVIVHIDTVIRIHTIPTMQVPVLIRYMFMDQFQTAVKTNIKQFCRGLSSILTLYELSFTLKSFLCMKSVKLTTIECLVRNSKMCVNQLAAKVHYRI